MKKNFQSQLENNIELDVKVKKSYFTVFNCILVLNTKDRVTWTDFL